MENFWTKAVIAIVVIVAVAGGINYFKGQKSEQPAPQERTVGDAWRADDKRLRAEPNVPAQPPTTGETTVEPSKPLQFRELTEEEQAGAEQLFEMVVAQRKMARLPGVGYKLMVDYCRQIIEKYPGSEFEYKARRALGEVPRDQRDRYKITEEEIKFLGK